MRTVVVERRFHMLLPACVALWKDVSTTEDMGRTVVVERRLLFPVWSCGSKFPQLTVDVMWRDMWLWKEVSTCYFLCGSVEGCFHN